MVKIGTRLPCNPWFSPWYTSSPFREYQTELKTNIWIRSYYSLFNTKLIPPIFIKSKFMYLTLLISRENLPKVFYHKNYILTFHNLSFFMVENISSRENLPEVFYHKNYILTFHNFIFLHGGKYIQLAEDIYM